MEHIFYLLGLLAICWEITVFKSPGKVISFFKKIRSKEPVEEYSKNQTILVFLMVGYIIWCLIGLMSSQWILFLLLITLGLVLPKKYKTTIIIDAILSILILLFIIINKYHLKINLLTYLINY